MKRALSGLLAASAIALHGAALAECATPERALPAEGIVADKQALIAWKPVQGASAYLRVNVPHAGRGDAAGGEVPLLGDARGRLVIC